MNLPKQQVLVQALKAKAPCSLYPGLCTAKGTYMVKPDGSLVFQIGWPDYPECELRGLPTNPMDL